jgi:hypothetical protein
MIGRGKVWDWIKKAGRWVKDKAIPYIRDNKLISRGLSMIPHPYAQMGSTAAGALGFGRRRGLRRIRYR